MLARLVLFGVMSIMLPSALLAKDSPKPIVVLLDPPVGGKFHVLQDESFSLRENDRQTVLSKRRSAYELSVQSSAAEGWLVSLKRTQVTWDPNGASAEPHIAIGLALEAALADAEIDVPRSILFSRSGKVIGLPDGRKFGAAILAALPRGLNRFLLSPELVQALGGKQAADNYVHQVHQRMQRNLPGKEPDLLGTWLQHTLVFPYGLPVQIGKLNKRNAPLKTVRVIAPTEAETTWTVTQDAANRALLITSFETVYDKVQLTRRALRDQTGKLQAILSRRIKAEPDKQAEHEAWASELIRRLKSELSFSRIDRATLVIDRNSGWPVSFQAENVETFRGLTEKMAPNNHVLSQRVDVRFKAQ